MVKRTSTETLRPELSSICPCRDYAAFITKDDARPCEQKLSAPDSRCELLHGEKTAQALEAAKPTGSAPQGVRV